jgi:hypothetical protein
MHLIFLQAALARQKGDVKVKQKIAFQKDL